MLDKINYEMEYIRKIQKESHRDPILIERVLYAFGLLEAIKRVGMPFVFKGGTCLMLLLEHPMRLSTDIDIIVEPGTDVDYYIEEAGKLFPFIRFDEQKRIGKNNIVKRHFKFIYESPINNADFYILLDILFEENHYSSIDDRPIKNELLTVVEPELFVKVPSVNCILGDKLTAFAPHTIGIPFGKNTEIIKQLYDCAILTGVITDFQEVKNTYRKIAIAELDYRGLDVTFEETLRDTIRVTACIISKGYSDPEEFSLFIEGINGVKSHIFNETYSGEKATFQACKVMCLAAYVLKDKPDILKIEHPEKYLSGKISAKEYQKLSYVKKLNLEAYGYLVEAVSILEEIYD